MPSSLGSRLFIVVRQADENLAVSINFLKAHLGCLNGFMALVASYE